LAKQSTDKKERAEFPSPARGRAVHLAPSILAADFADLKGAVTNAQNSGLRWFHLDIMDGHFVPNISFGPLVLESLRPLGKDAFYDVHLMVENPRNYVKPFVNAGSQLITFHVEAAGEDTTNLLRHIKRQGLQAGVSIRPKTPVASLEPHLEAADLVLIMTVEPGFGGQKLIPSTLNKVRELVMLREQRGLSYLIQVDGGINTETAGLAVAAGADVLVAGSAIFRGGPIKENVKNLRKSLHLIR
jgi:ribulose-phosphate 3-epimerase